MTKWWFFWKVLGIHVFCLLTIMVFYQSLHHAIPDIRVHDETIRTSTPLSEKTMVETSVNSATSTVFFTGDIMMARQVEYLLSKHGADYSFKNLGFLREVPAYVVGNFEASIPFIHKKTPDFGYTFSVDQKYIPILDSAGVTHLSLANNHSHDTGTAGFINTKAVLASSSIVSFGEREGLASTSITYLTISGKRIAIIGIHTLVSTPREHVVQQYIATHASTSDLVIAYIHWGTEYERAQSHWQRSYAQELVSAGVDVIIGHHPHVVQGVEKIGNSIVFYSLGNLIFDQYFSTDVQEGLIIKMIAINDGFAFELKPVTSIATPAQPREVVGEERTHFLELLAKYSDPQLQSEILTGKIFMTHSLATSTEMSIMDQ